MDKNKNDLGKIAAQASTGNYFSATVTALRNKKTRTWIISISTVLVLLVAAQIIIPLMVVNMIFSGSTSRTVGMTRTSYETVKSDDIDPEELKIIMSEASAQRIPWEVLAAARKIQKDKTPNPYGLESDAPTEMKGATAQIAQTIRQATMGTVGNLQYQDLRAGTESITQNGETYKLVESQDPERKKSAESLKTAWTQALSTIPFKGSDRSSELIYEKARFYAIGEKGGSCEVLPVSLGGTLASGAWTNPLISKSSSGFGPRPGIGTGGFHEGSDLPAPGGTPFVSASDGVVLSTPGDNGEPTDPYGGHGIIIDVGGGVNIWYWHMPPGATKVKKGDQVKAGQAISAVGTTGLSTGDHLHYQIMVNGKATDPVEFMKARGVNLGSDPVGGAGSTNIDIVPASQPVQSNGEGLKISKSGEGEFSLTKEQAGNFSAVLGTLKELNATEDEKIITLITILQESKGWMFANSNVPDSLGIPHQQVGKDHDSVGLYQQRQTWGQTKDLMDPVWSTKAFIGGEQGPNKGNPPGLRDKKGNYSSPGAAAQAVQVSAFPDEYENWVPAARTILSTIEGTTPPPQCTNTQEPGESVMGDRTVGKLPEARQKIIDAAKQGIGGEYVQGGKEFKKWDSPGYTQWAYKEAGIRLSETTYSQYPEGNETSAPQPGDLVFLNPSAYDQTGKPTRYERVGIYSGEKDGEAMFYTALRPGRGTLLMPIKEASNGDPFVYVNVIGD